jgi:N-acetylglucosamine-6-phosphate deacetylase
MTTKTFTTPGFWDLHLHGAAGVDFMHADDDAIVHACEKLGRNGTAVFAPTLLTAEPALLEASCRRWGRFLNRAQKNSFLPPRAARPLGLHLEGPFLSPSSAGAHPQNWLKKPDLRYAELLITLAEHHVAIVTLAPELPGAIALIRKLRRAGIRVQLGHTQASTDEALAAARAGASGITHFANAMRLHHREPGLLALVEQNLATAEVITDGVHLDPSFVFWCMKAGGPSFYAVSDGCSAVGCSASKQTLTLGSLILRKKDAAAVVAKTGTLAGGATYLAEHPARLWKGRNSDSAVRSKLALFHRVQASLFPGFKSSRVKNVFDAKSLRFIDTL